MKVKDLFGEQKVIHKNVFVPRNATKLNYEGVVVRGKFSCYGTKITSLEGAPSYVEGDFNCNKTAITSLEGAPSYVGGQFLSHQTKISSLHNVHKTIKHIGGVLYLSKTIKSNVLGVMMIKGLRRVSFYEGSDEHATAGYIINKHLSGNRDVHACQEEMLEAGLGEYAKL